jgi:hypothetical protein
MRRLPKRFRLSVGSSPDVQRTDHGLTLQIGSNVACGEVGHICDLHPKTDSDFNPQRPDRRECLFSLSRKTDRLVKAAPFFASDITNHSKPS